MGRARYWFFTLLFVSLAIFKVNGFCADTPTSNNDQAIGRYQIYATQTVMVLLDTKTGKMWKITSDMTGKSRAEGVTVEGIAYSSTELDALNNKFKDVNLEGVSDRDKKTCMDELTAQFSYLLDREKVNKVLNMYRLKKE